MCTLSVYSPRPYVLVASAILEVLAWGVELTLATRCTQDIKSAAEFYERKVKELGTNIQDLESIVQNKSNSLRVVDEGELSQWGAVTCIHLRGKTRDDH